jgi:hypothetical protein
MECELDRESGKRKRSDFSGDNQINKTYRFKILGFLLYDSEESKYAKESIYAYYLFVPL